MSNTLKSSLSTVISFKPIGFIITINFKLSLLHRTKMSISFLSAVNLCALRIN